MYGCACVSLSVPVGVCVCVAEAHTPDAGDLHQESFVLHVSKQQPPPPAQTLASLTVMNEGFSIGVCVCGHANAHSFV